MSHVATIELQIKDLDSLAKACESLGLELVRNQTHYKWYGQSVGDYPLPDGFTRADLGKCEHAIRVTGNNRAYEIGVTARRDGLPGYTLLWDFWNGGYGLESAVGNNADKLKQAYTLAVARKQYAMQGYRLQQTTKADGTIVLTASR